jgi:hypothetical protein
MSKSMISVFKASREELWASLKTAGVTGEATWKTSSREDMIRMCVKNDIEEVKPITESSDLAKKLSKVFTPEFFKLMSTVETTIAQALADPDAVTIEDAPIAAAGQSTPTLVTAPTVEQPRTLATALKKN